MQEMFFSRIESTYQKTVADIKPEELGVKYVTKRYQDYAKEMFPDSLKNTSEIKLVRQDMGYGIR